MTCPNCEAIVAEGERFCPNCGADMQLVSNTDEIKQPKKEKSNNLIKLIPAVIIIIVVAAITLFIIKLVADGQGENTLEKFSENLGRSVAMAEKNTKLELKTTSEYSILKDINNYDYIYESEKSTKVEGINIPEWVIFISIDDNDKIKTVTYYDFKVLKKSWKGEKISEKFDTNLINFKMPLKEAKKIIPLKPLAITCSNNDETLYLYKYYFTDTEDKNEKAYYLTVGYDMDNNVKGIDGKESDYVSFIFK